MTIHFSAKQRQYEAHKKVIDDLLLQSVTQEKMTCTLNSKQLESDLSRYIGAKDAIVCNTQFNAFILLFMVLELKAGDEVITSTLGSGIAVQAALFMGAKVVFVDVMEENFTLDVEQVEDAITERTKLIIPVSLFGQCADMATINALAEQHDLYVIEDAAESLGSRHKAQPSCQLSKLATTSFFTSMPLNGFGNGAALFITDDDLRAKARILRSQGRVNDDYTAVGIEACMDEIQAAVVDYKLSIYDDEIAKRHTVAQHYADALSKSPIKLPNIDKESNAAYYPVLLNDRQSVIERLVQKGIETKVPFTKPLHLHDAFSFMHYVKGDFPISERVVTQLLLLPLHAYLTVEEQDKVIHTIH